MKLSLHTLCVSSCDHQVVIRCCIHGSAFSTNAVSFFTAPCHYTCRALDHKHDRLREERELWEEEKAQLIRERGQWAEQRGAALAAAEQAATLQAALASHMGNAPLLKVIIFAMASGISGSSHGR